MRISPWKTRRPAAWSFHSAAAVLSTLAMSTSGAPQLSSAMARPRERTQHAAARSTASYRRSRTHACPRVWTHGCPPRVVSVCVSLEAAVGRDDGDNDSWRAKADRKVARVQAPVSSSNQGYIEMYPWSNRTIGCHACCTLESIRTNGMILPW